MDEYPVGTLRSALPTLHELAQLAGAKAETVCRAPAQRQPPRRRKIGPARLNLEPSLFAPWVSQQVQVEAMA